MESYENLLLAQQFYNMGLKYLENENYNDAIRFFSKAIDFSKNVNHPGVYFSRADAYQGIGEFQKAIDDYNNIWANDLVISDELKNYKYFNIGNVYFKAGNISEALINYKKALSFNPNDYQAQHMIMQLQNKYNL